MDNETFNQSDNTNNPIPSGTKNPLSSDIATPTHEDDSSTMRPLQPVGAKYVQHAEQTSQSEDQNAPVFRDKPPKSPTLTGAICGIVGIIVGAAGIYGLMQLIKKPEPKCEDCNCPQCPANATTSNNLTTSFLTLEPQGQNMLYSPLSIRYGLSLLNAGAAGSTQTEIANVLGEDTLPQYTNVPDKLSLANAVFIRDTYTDSVLPSYTDTVTQDYDAEIFLDSFDSSANMDSWVNNKTFGLINQIGVQPTTETKMVLANALAIQMDWQHRFDTEDTRGNTFYKEDNSEIEATTMSMTAYSDDISYFQDDQTTMLSMPLKPVDNSTALEFVAVMPSGSLSNYLTNLDYATIESNLQNSTPASTPEDGVVIHIPKFKYEYELNFKQDLESLGINQAFTPNADFSNMTSDPQGLYVSDAIHKANIDFSEDGIKAAAITVFKMDVAAAAEERVPKPVIIDIDHPFLFLIRDKADGTVWFTGTVYEPNLWSDDQALYQS